MTLSEDGMSFSMSRDREEIPALPPYSPPLRPRGWARVKAELVAAGPLIGLLLFAALMTIATMPR